MRADIYTKPFVSGPKFRHALSLIGIVPHAEPSLCAAVSLPVRRASEELTKIENGNCNKVCCNDIGIQTDSAVADAVAEGKIKCSRSKHKENTI